MLVKSLAPRHFSFVMFAIAQVVIDIEPALGMLFAWQVLHGWTHTLLGATAIAAVVTVMGRPVAQALLGWWNAHLDDSLSLLQSPEPITWISAAAGAFIGTWSHVALDSLMHADLHPFAPLSTDNPLLYAVTLDTLHLGCVVAGIFGLGIWLAHRRNAARRIS